MGKKSCELTPDLQKEIVRIFMAMEETEVSKIFSNTDFGFWKVTVLQPQTDGDGRILTDKKGNPVPDKDKTDTELIPFTYPGGIEGFMDAEVRPYAPQAYVDYKKLQTGYELSFTKYFYKHVSLRPMEEIVDKVHRIESEIGGLLTEIVEGRHD